MELPQPRPFGADGRKTTHDFFSLYSPVQQDPITSQGCNGVLLESHNCRSILPNQVFYKWGDALCEATISKSDKFYCPFKDCSTLLLDEGRNEDEIITQAECPECKNLFCAECKVGWHEGVECQQYQEQNASEGKEFFELAKDQEWQICPNCRIYVDKTEGCDSINAGQSPS